MDEETLQEYHCLIFYLKDVNLTEVIIANSM